MNIKQFLILSGLFLVVCAAWTWADTYHYSDRIEIDGDPVLVSGVPWTTSQNASGQELYDLSWWNILNGNTRVKINSTGLWVDGGEGYFKITFSDDIVVCRGTSSIDDIIENFRCNYVCDHDDLDCGDEINSASNSVESDTVNVLRGTYPIKTSIMPRSDMDIISKGAYLVIADDHTMSTIDIKGWNTTAPIILNNTKNNLIYGFRINGSTDSKTPPIDPDDAIVGIFCFECNDTIIERNEIFDFGTVKTTYTGYGILLINGTNVDITHNIVHDIAYEGIGVRLKSKTIFVYKNKVYDTRVHCIQVAGYGDVLPDHDTPTGVIIDNNICGDGTNVNENKIISHNADFISIINNIVPRIQVFSNVSDITIKNNLLYTFYDFSEGAGIELKTTATTNNNISRVTIEDNTFYNLYGHSTLSSRGIKLWAEGTNSINDVIIKNNKINVKSIPIYLHPATNKSIRNIVIDTNLIKANTNVGGIVFDVAEIETLIITTNIFSSGLARGIYNNGGSVSNFIASDNIFEIDSNKFVTIGTHPGTIVYDENYAEHCRRCYSDGVCNSTIGVCS